MIATAIRYSKIPTKVAQLHCWLDAHDGLNLRQQMLVFVVTALAIISRLPSLIIHAQFYAEDGKVWYRQAYEQGWLHSLMLPNVGYLTTLPRLGAGLALLVPLRWAPLVMTLFGLFIQCLPVTVLLSRRCRSFGPLSLRAAFALSYVVCPNAREIHMVATNTQWHLALAVVLLSFAEPPVGWAGRAFDILAFTVLGLSAPFCIVLAPLVFLYFWFRRHRWTLVQAAILTVSALIQLHLLRTTYFRVAGPLGASLPLFLRVFGGNIIGCAIFGGFRIGLRAPMLLVVLASIGGVLLFSYALRYASLELKLLILFCIGLFAGALKSPLTGSPLPQWPILVQTPSCRYWFFPMIGFLWGLIWCVKFARHSILKRIAVYTLVLSVVGVVAQWEYKPYANRNFAKQAQRFRDANPGTAVRLLIIPDDWNVTLVKKNPAGSY